MIVLQIAIMITIHLKNTFGTCIIYMVYIITVCKFNVCINVHYYNDHYGYKL